MLGWLLGCRACDYMRRTAEAERDEVVRTVPKRYREPGDSVIDMVKRVVADVDGQITDRHNAQCELAAARSDVQALNARAKEDARRITKAAELLDDERERNETLAAENVALKAELESLRTLIGNARNQLDGRAHHTSIETAECCGA